MKHEHKVVNGNDWYVVRGEEGVVAIEVMPLLPGYAQRFGMMSSHSRKPQYKDDTPYGECEWLDGEVCYCNAMSIARSDRIIELRVDSDAFWKALENVYTGEFKE